MLRGVEAPHQVTDQNRPNGAVETAAPLSLPDEKEQKIQSLELRVAHLENEIARFQTALVMAGKFIFENPASKMMLAAFPKEMQSKLKEFFSGT